MASSLLLSCSSIDFKKDLQMSEGLYTPSEFTFPLEFPKEKVLLSIVKVAPQRRLNYKMFDNLEEADNWSKWITHKDGSQTLNYGVIAEDKDKCRDPEFSQALFSHELCEIFKEGKALPREEKLRGNGNGVLISNDGYILTNFHLISGVIEANNRGDKDYINKPIEITGVDIEYPISISTNGDIIYKKAQKVFLISNPSTGTAYKGKHDLALLKIETEASHYLELKEESTKEGDSLNLVGFTMRTGRKTENLKKYNYKDAQYDLRISSGKFVKLDSDSTFLSSTDGGPGNSGSATVDDEGSLVGIYFGATANGIVDPSNSLRRNVLSSSIIKFFELGRQKH